jgi:tetratricopeptide (TPR) repeat protein
MEEWNENEAQARQSLEQRLRQRPGDRDTMITLATLLATKLELAEAANLLMNAAVGINNDKNCASLLRKLASAKLAMWRGMRRSETNSLYINTTTERKGLAYEAVDFFEQAICHPENAQNPVVIIEGANAKLAVGNLVGALKDFSAVIANYPEYPQLNAVIYRAACLLMILGEMEQAMQYLAYVLDDPPISIGGGELEVRALLIVCSVEASKPNKDATRRMYTAMADALLRCEIRKELPPGFVAIPPKDTTFPKWASPWKLLADRMLVVSVCNGLTASFF